MAENNGNEKIDVLVDPVKQLPEGSTDSNRQLNRVEQSIERQERNIDRLIALLEQKSQQDLETVQRLEQIAKNLLEQE